MILEALNTLLTRYWQYILTYLQGIALVFDDKNNKKGVPGQWDLTSPRFNHQMHDHTSQMLSLLSLSQTMMSYSQIDKVDSPSIVGLDQDIANMGAHICVRVQLCSSSAPVIIDPTLFDPSNQDSRRLRTRTMPLHSEYLEVLNTMYGVLGEILVKLPDLRRIYINPIRSLSFSLFKIYFYFMPYIPNISS